MVGGPYEKPNKKRIIESRVRSCFFRSCYEFRTRTENPQPQARRWPQLPFVDDMLGRLTGQG